MEDTKEILTVESIRNCVYIIRGQQVVLDSDLASIYGYEVKRLNEQVKRNINRFPEDFMFQLTMDEVDLVKSHFATSSQENLKSQMRLQVGAVKENFRMLLLSREYICLLLFLEEN